MSGGHRNEVVGAFVFDAPVVVEVDVAVSGVGAVDEWQALVQLVAWLATVCHIDTAKVIGHRDTGIATDCPGQWLWSRLPALRQQAHQLKKGSSKP